MALAAGRVVSQPREPGRQGIAEAPEGLVAGMGMLAVVAAAVRQDMPATEVLEEVLMRGQGLLALVAAVVVAVQTNTATKAALAVAVSG